MRLIHGFPRRLGTVPAKISQSQAGLHQRGVAYVGSRRALRAAARCARGCVQHWRSQGTLVPRMTSAGSCTVHALLSHVFVISLPGRSPRLIHDFAGRGVRNVVLWPAITKDMLDLERLRAASHQRLLQSSHANISVKAFATALSHRSLHDYVLMNQLPCVIIAEDDTDILGDFVPRLHSLIETAPLDFDWIKLLHCSELGRGPLPTSTVLSSLTLSTVARAGVGNACGGAAYILSLAGARLLRAVQTPVWMNADGSMDPQHVRTSKQRTPRCYHSEPPLAYHSRSPRSSNVSSES